MSSEIWFKVAFGLAFIYAVTVAARTARQATRVHGGSVNQLQHEVKGLLVTRALLGLVFYAALGIWLVRAEPLSWLRLPVSTPIRWSAVTLLVPVLAFYHWSFRSLGTNYRGGVGLHAQHALVTTGAYRWVRHPIYLAFIAVMVLVLLLSANWLLGLAGLLLVISIAGVRIPREERELAQRFSTAWSDYAAVTGRVLPRPPRS